MKKKFIINRCCDCPFNDHGQENSFGGPQLECWYDPDESFRDNFRGSRYHKLNFIIWKSSWNDKTEFEKQLNGFPKRCPLKEDL